MLNHLDPLLLWSGHTLERPLSKLRTRPRFNLSPVHSATQDAEDHQVFCFLSNFKCLQDRHLGAAVRKPYRLRTMALLEQDGTWLTSCNTIRTARALRIKAKALITKRLLHCNLHYYMFYLLCTLKSILRLQLIVSCPISELWIKPGSPWSCILTDSPPGLCYSEELRPLFPSNSILLLES